MDAVPALTGRWPRGERQAGAYAGLVPDGEGVVGSNAGLKVIDADTHYSEPADLWVSRVPEKFREQVPHQVARPEGGHAWMVAGDQVLSPRAGAGSVILKDKSKVSLWDWNIEGGSHVSEVHEASYDPAARDLDMRGIVMCSEPHAGGLPDLVDKHWDPLWAACSDLQMPINLHVGASEFGYDAFRKGVWPSLDHERAHVVGCVQLEMHNG